MKKLPIGPFSQIRSHIFDDIGFIFMNWKLKNLLIKNRFFHFYFLTIDFLVNI